MNIYLLLWTYMYINWYIHTYYCSEYVFTVMNIYVLLWAYVYFYNIDLYKIYWNELIFTDTNIYLLLGIHIYSYEHIFTAMKAYLLLWTYISCREYYFTVINICIEYQNKKYAFNWLNTLHVTFTSPRYRLSCWYRPVQKPCIDRCYPIDLCTVFGPVYISINRNFKTPSMILIKSTFKMFICLYVRFYLFLKLQYQDIQNSLGSWYGPWNRYFPRLRFGQYHFHWSVPRSLGSLYISILPSISVTII